MLADAAPPPKSAASPTRYFVFLLWAHFAGRVAAVIQELSQFSSGTTGHLSGLQQTWHWRLTRSRQKQACFQSLF
ncbi:hypothetical protein, partial [uncultured Roseobacter sp.]|uniref:hypothetical protein n=1 Tax=uncultured Roseobacter sp. TaxID=114847 RepID=UPI0026073CA2